MRVTRLYLENYRVYEGPLDLEIPPGLVGIYGVNGAGKCLPAATRVWDADSGEGVSIERFVRERRKWTLGYTGNKIKPVEVTDWHELGDKPTVVVRLDSGVQIETATSHPILTDHGCVSAAELRPGDWVAEARELPAVAPARISTDEALILGMLLGDGCVTSSLSLSASDPDVVVAFRDAVERVFPGCTVRSCGTTQIIVSRLTPDEKVATRQALAKRLTAAGVPLDAYLGVNVHRFLRGQAGLGWATFDAIEHDHELDLWEERCALHGGRVAREWARELDVLGHGFDSKRVPADLLLLPVDQVRSLLAGLWLTDGYVRDPDEYPGRSIEASYTTGSPGLADDVRVLLLRLGMVSTRTTRRVGRNLSHTVTVTAEAAGQLAELPLVGAKAKRAQAVMRHRSSVVAHPLEDLIPPSFCAQLPTRASSGRSRSPKQLARHAMSRRVYLDFGGNPDVALAPLRWSQVSSVTPTGRKVACFDVTVDTPEHLYVAETLVVHNSYLLESILFALWGRSRTELREVRTTGVHRDCIVECEFEHEGHLYMVRRTLKGGGRQLQSKAAVFADGQQVAEGSNDTKRYIHSILGMDDAPFRASVFAEQKQLAAFSDQGPAERKRLVLKLLGITPLDDARDLARKDAKAAHDRFDDMRSVLPDLDALEAALDGTKTEVERCASEAATHEQDAAAARTTAEAAEAAFRQLEEQRREHDDLMKQGKAARAQQDDALERVQKHQKDLANLVAASDRVSLLQNDAAGLEDAEARLQLVRSVVNAMARVDAIAMPAEPPIPDDAAAERARTSAEEASAALAAVEAAVATAREEVARARIAAERSSELSGEAACPLCGQELGDAFASVQAHRAEELAEREQRAAVLEADRTAAAAAVGTAREQAANLAREIKAARDARAAWEASQAARSEALAALADSIERLGYEPSADEPQALAAEVEKRKAARQEHTRLQAQLERRPALEAELASEQTRLAQFTDLRNTLLEKIKALAFDTDAPAAAEATYTRAKAAASKTAEEARDAKVALAAASARLEGNEQALASAEAQHANLAASGEDARHLSRLADLLQGFREGVVAKVGPMLQNEAGELFGELTNHEYDDFQVDPDTYEIKLGDAGANYGMGRFSGSETDLANLALRIAISEQVRLQSGGTVGLLVLDEVFGPLDEDRKDRMLAALQQLTGRFRQILVVTHDDEIKEQLPTAIEVVKLPGRRATARLINA